MNVDDYNVCLLVNQKTALYMSIFTIQGVALILACLCKHSYVNPVHLMLRLSVKRFKFSIVKINK